MLATADIPNAAFFSSRKQKGGVSPKLGFAADLKEHAAPGLTQSEPSTRP